MRKKYLFNIMIILFLLFNIINFSHAMDQQTVIACAGDSQLIIPCLSGDIQNYPFNNYAANESRPTGGIVRTTLQSFYGYLNFMDLKKIFLILLFFSILVLLLIALLLIIKLKKNKKKNS